MLDILWPDLDQCLSLDELSYSASDISLHIATTAPNANCPVCQLPSTNVHSHYQRSLCDLPVAGLAVRIQLRVRRFFCCASDCPRRIFAERLSALTRPYAHRTTRMSAALRRIGLALGGEAGGRLAADLQLSGSADTILRFVRQTPDEQIAAAPRVLGIDDFCFRKGQTYGSILVDLETHHVVDLLPDRQATTVAAWLLQHPGAQIISRDRAGAYAEGARLGAPDAIQIADRFHLLVNLGDALEELLVRLYPQLRQVMQSTEPPDAATMTAIEIAPPDSGAAQCELGSGEVVDEPTHDAFPACVAIIENEQEAQEAQEAQETTALTEPQVRLRRRDTVLSDARRQTRQNRYDEVQQLYQLGWNKVAISRKVGLSRDTVAKWVQSHSLLQQQARPRRLRAYPNNLV